MKPRDAAEPGLSVLIVEQGGRGGVADYTEALARALTAEGVGVVLATARDHLYGSLQGVEIRTPFYYLRSGGHLRDTLRRARLHKVVNGLMFLVAVPFVSARARRARVVHLQGGELPPLYLVLVLALRIARVPIVHTMHSTFARRRAWRRARRLIASCASEVIVHTESDLQNLPEDVLPRTHVIPHGEYGGLARRGGGVIDSDQARRSLGLPLSPLIALLFGHLRRDKGLDDVLVAARQVPDVHFVVAGQEQGALAATASLRVAPGIRERVHVFEGFHPLERVGDFFSAADVVLIPYRRASQSGVLLLAYGFGRPVVAYPTGGLLETVDPERTGWITARADPSALAEALRAVVAAGRDECRRRGAEGMRFAVRRFGWKDIARQTIGVYTEALD